MSTYVPVPSTDGLLLEGRLHEPPDPPRGVAVLCHPHPAFGGHMDVWLLPAVAARLAADGWAALRINFRGVEGSAGAQTGGRDEHRDAAGALRWLRDRHPSLPAAAVGWSFGAMIALRLGRDLDAWVGIGPPTRPVPEVPLEGPLLPADWPPHRTAIVGEHDQFYPPSTIAALRPDRVVVIEGADHFLFDRDPEVAEAVAGALTDVLVPARDALAEDETR